MFEIANKDIFWIQSYKSSKDRKNYMIAKSENPADWEWTTKKKAFKEFEKLLLEKFKLSLLQVGII